MANNTIRRAWNRDGMVHIEDLRGSAYQAEEKGHTFQIHGTDVNGNAVALYGTASAVFLRADSVDVVLTGTISDGIVSITLTEECYDVPGRFGLTIYLTSDGQTTAIYAAIGSVSRTSSGIVSSGTVDDVEDLIARINAAIASIPVDYSAFQTMTMMAYNAARVEYKNDVVNKDNTLYIYDEYVQANSEWDASKVSGTQLSRLATRGINIGENAVRKNPYINRLQYAIRMDGIAIRASDGAYLDRPSFTTFIRIPTTPGARIILSEVIGSSTYGIVFSKADGSALPTSTNLTYLNREGGFYAPQEAYWMTFTCKIGNAGTAYVYCVTPEENRIVNFDIYQLQAIGQLVNGGQYNAFPTMTEFNNKKVMSWMSSNDHFASAGTGGVTIADIDGNGFLSIHDIVGHEMGTKPWNGVLDGSSLCTSRDGKHLLFAGFSTYKVSNVDKYDSVILELDKNYEIVAYKVFQDSSDYFFSKVMETPANKLIICSYSSNGNIIIYHSNEAYNGSNLASLTWQKVTIISSMQYAAEADIGYVKNKLVCVVRRNTTSALYLETSDLEGLTGWSNTYEIGEIIHAPRIIPYTDDDYLVIVGAKYVSSEIRYPAMVVYDTASHALIDSSVMNTNVNRYGGYSDLVRTGKYTYEVIYYSDPTSDTNSCTEMFYQKVNIREMCPACRMLM